MGRQHTRFLCVWILYGSATLTILSGQDSGGQPELVRPESHGLSQSSEFDFGTAIALQGPGNSVIVTEDRRSTEQLPLDDVLPPPPPMPKEVCCDPPDFEDDDLEVGELAFFGDWLGYKSRIGDWTWIPESDDGLGIFSIESFPIQKLGESASLSTQLSFHFLNGPIRTDLPPRLFDLVLGYHSRNWVSDRTMVSFKYSLGIFTDFEGSARKGVRFPGHFVVYTKHNSEFATVLGVEVLDRDDISLLPVAGVVYSYDECVYEFVFPNPRVQWKHGSNAATYVSGELGGGTWAIERDTLTNDNVTLSDIRVVGGIINYDSTSSCSLEVGYVFNRSLEYRSGIGNYEPEDAWIFRLRTHY